MSEAVLEFAAFMLMAFVMGYIGGYFTCLTTLVGEDPYSIEQENK